MAGTVNQQDFSTTADQDNIFVLTEAGERFINLGHLNTSGDFASAVYVAASGVRVTNAGSITTTGDAAPGITVGELFGAHYDNVTVVNDGSITVTGDAIFEDFTDGIDAFGNNSTLINHGIISATNLNGTGMAALGSDCLVVNYGTIVAGQTGMEASTYFGAGTNNTVINHGLIQVIDGEDFSVGIQVAFASDSLIENYGAIKLSGFIFQGIRPRAGSGDTVRNYGTIEADGVRGFGISIPDNSHGENRGTIAVTGQTLVAGIFMDGQGGSFDNFGLIQASGAVTSIGVRLSGADGTFTNYGTVESAGFSVLGLDIKDPLINHDDQVINRGLLIGDVSLGGGDDSYTAGSGGHLDGLLMIGGGDDLVVVERNAGDLTITDFVAGAGTNDVIDLAAFGFRSFAEVMSHATQSGTEVVFSLGSNTNLLFQNTSLASFSADDFLLA